MVKCTKRKFATKALAVGNAFSTTRAQLDVQKIGAFRCPTCRYPDGRRAWHWGHRRPRWRRK